MRPGYLSIAEDYYAITGLSVLTNTGLTIGTYSQACTQSTFGNPPAVCNVGPQNPTQTVIVPFTLGQTFTFNQTVTSYAAVGAGTIPHYANGQLTVRISLLEGNPNNPQSVPVVLADAPEPQSIALLGSGLAGLLVLVKRSRRRGETESKARKVGRGSPPHGCAVLDWRPDMGKLEGKVAVITGATSGIGAESARLFAREGARLIVGGRREHLAQEIATELGNNVVPLRMDVTNESDIAAAADLAVQRFGRLDCWFNNAGSAGVLGSIMETPAEALDDTISVLLRSVVLGMKHAARLMKPTGSGTIITTASVAGFFTGYAPHVYSACKGATIQLTRSVATELAEQGIRVNCICPGPIATPIFGSAFGLAEKQSEALTGKLDSVFQGVQPLKRAGECADIAQTALWLASDDSAFVTGHAMVVDGGLTLGQSWSGMQEYLGKLMSLVPH